MASDAAASNRRPLGFPGSSPSFKKAFAPNDLSCAALIHRHRFLLTALALLVLLCSVYLYFAVTLGNGESCLGLVGTDLELCRLKRVGSATVGKSKLL